MKAPNGKRIADDKLEEIRGEYSRAKKDDKSFLETLGKIWAEGLKIAKLKHK